MLTFLISAAVFFLIGGCIYNKNIKQHQFHIALIVVIGTLISTSIVNGVMGLKIPYTYVEVKEKPLTSWRKTHETVIDSTKYYWSLIEFDVEVQDDGDTLWRNLEFKERTINRLDKNAEIHFLNDIDTIPRWRLIRQKRIVDNNWVIPLGLPRGDQYYEIYIPNDSIHQEMVSLIERYWGEIKVIGLGDR